MLPTHPMSKPQILVLTCALTGCGDDSATPADSSPSSPTTTTASGSAGSETSANTDSDPDSSGPGVDPGEIQEIQIEVDAFVFDARAAGPEDGQLVILLHGFPQTSYEWRHQLTALGQAGYRAVAPDQRGYSPGARPEDTADYAYALLIDDVLDIADELAADSFHLVGHDWGAAVAWGVAARSPERVTSLAAVSVPHIDAFNAQLTDMESCQYEASAYFEFFASTDSTAALLADDAAALRGIYEDIEPEAIEQYVGQLGTAPALDAALNWYRANVDGRLLHGDPIGPITVPTMFIWSDGDVAICREGADATADFVTGPYRFEVLEGIGHWVPELASETVSMWLLENVQSAQ